MGTAKDDPPPVTRKHRKLIAENRMFEVYFDHIIAQDQTVVPEYLVVVPKQRTPDGVTGVAILPVVDNKIALLKIYRQDSSKHLLAHIQERPLPVLPPIQSTTPLPASNFLAIAGFARKFLFDTSLPLSWRTYCFEVFSRRYLLKKYKYPKPTWQYKLLKMLAPILKWPLQFIQKFK